MLTARLWSPLKDFVILQLPVCGLLKTFHFPNGSWDETVFLNRQGKKYFDLTGAIRVKRMILKIISWYD